MEAYFAAKQLLFKPRKRSPPRFAVLNADDEGARKIELAPETLRLLVRSEARAAFHVWFENHVDSGAANVEMTIQRAAFHRRWRATASSRRIATGGPHQRLQYSAGLRPAISLGLTDAQIQKGLHDMPRVPGRFERVEEGQPFMVVVDYAHTDDALRNVISVARAMNPKRIITLFGCGGDRDRVKRPLMGMAAAELSDYVVLTSDNPRSEDPLAIMNDASVGLGRFDTPSLTEPDRERAIKKAIEMAEPGDVVILAGRATKLIKS